MHFDFVQLIQGQDVLLVGAWGVPRRAGFEPLAATVARASLLAASNVRRWELERLAPSIGVDRASIGRMSDRQLVVLLAAAVEEGRLIAYRQTRRVRVLRGGESAAGALGPAIDLAAEAAEASSKTFIEIVLVDGDDLPVTGQPFEIIAPDGKKHRGTTDARGKARIEGIDPGSCDVSLVQLDTEAWSA